MLTLRNEPFYIANVRPVCSERCLEAAGRHLLPNLCHLLRAQHQLGFRLDVSNIPQAPGNIFRHGGFKRAIAHKYHHRMHLVIAEPEQSLQRFYVLVVLVQWILEFVTGPENLLVQKR